MLSLYWTLTLFISQCHWDLKMGDTGMTYLEPGWSTLPYPLMVQWWSFLSPYHLTVTTAV